MNNFKKIDDVMKALEFKSAASVYSLIKKEIFPPPIKVNNRSFWLEPELALIQAAYVSGVTNEKKKEIVAEIMQKRLHFLAELNSKHKESYHGTVQDQQ